MGCCDLIEESLSQPCKVEINKCHSQAHKSPPIALTPIAVEPSLIASNEYSTWKSLPSGEKVLRHRNMSDGLQLPGLFERDVLDAAV